MFLVVLGINGQDTNKYRYSIGEPTAEEQLYLEYINRARTNAVAESIRLATTTDQEIRALYTFFGVDLVLMQQQFTIYPYAVPLSFNSNLIWAARQHTADQLTNDFQGHSGSDGTGPVDRMRRAGYDFIQGFGGENAFTSAKNVYFGHVGFEVDWGAGAGGMQTPPGHRHTIHGGHYREIGIGVTNASNRTVGPQLVTQDFSTREGFFVFLTGVVYYDFNRNAFYDLAEGVGGIKIDVDGHSYYAVSSKSGGYSIPIHSNGVYRVTFSKGDLVISSRLITVAFDRTYKLDLRIPYRKTDLSGPSVPVILATNIYTFPALIGANAYEVYSSQIIKTNIGDGFERGTNYYSFKLTGSYQPIQSSVKKTGLYSLRLAHPTPIDQVVSLNKRFKIESGSCIVFCSRLGWATSNQVATIQITTNNVNWETVWFHRGNSTAGQPFTKYTNYLAKYAGREASFRFVYDHTGGSYFNQTINGVGWYLDDFELKNIYICENETNTFLGTNTSFAVTFDNHGTFSMKVRGYSEGGPLPFGDEKNIITSSTNSPRMNIVKYNLGVLISFSTVFGYSYILQKSSDLNQWVDMYVYAGNNSIVYHFDDAIGNGFYRVIVR